MRLWAAFGDHVEFSDGALERMVDEARVHQAERTEDLNKFHQIFDFVAHARQIFKELSTFSGGSGHEFSLRAGNSRFEFSTLSGVEFSDVESSPQH